MGMSHSAEELEDLGRSLTPEGLKKGFLIVIGTIIVFRLVSFFSMNVHL